MKISKLIALLVEIEDGYGDVTVMTVRKSGAPRNFNIVDTCVWTDPYTDGEPEDVCTAMIEMEEVE